jgi:ABC-type transport system substrate-binding protein
MDAQDQSKLSRSGLLKLAAGVTATAAFSGPIVLRNQGVEAAASKTPTKGGKLVASVSEQIQIIDAYNSELATWRSIRENIFDTLIYADLEHVPYTLKPRLATAWKFTTPTTFDLTLRQGVKFHDGSSFDAEDVKFSLDRVLSLKGFLASGLGPVAKVTVLDPTHVRLTLSRPYAALAEGLSHICIYSKNATQTTFTQKLIGTGPFRFVSFNPTGATKLQRFDGYWEAGVPYLDEIDFQLISEDASRLAALASGQTDMLIQLALSDVNTVKQNANLVILRNVQQMFGDLFYINSHRKPFEDVNARQALSYMFDRQTFYKAFLGGNGYANVSPFTPQNWAYNPTEGAASRFPYDLTIAKQYLAKAGYPNGKGFHITFALVAGFPEWLQGAQMLQQVVNQIGGTMDILTQEGPVWVNTILKTFNYDVSFDFSDRASSDPAFTLNDGFQWNPDAGISRYHSPQVSKLLATASSTLDRAKRKPLYWEFQKLWNQNLWGLEHGKRDTISASTKRVGGYIENPSQYRNFRYTYISK